MPPRIWMDLRPPSSLPRIPLLPFLAPTETRKRWKKEEKSLYERRSLCLSIQLFFFFFFSLSLSLSLPPLAIKLRKTMERGVGSNRRGSGGAEKKELFHVIHKVPTGDSPYVRAKHLQLVGRDYDSAIVWFWKAINAGDRVDSALKDMAVVMKQQDRAEEAIEAIKSFRRICSKQAQESLDNLLIDLYKKCNMVEEQIELLKQKLRMIYLGEAFNGKTTKTARSRGRKFQVSIKQETARVLGNLGWAYMQQNNFDAAEAVYCKAQEIEPDANKACNLGICLMRKGNFKDAHHVLQDVVNHRFTGCEESKTVNRAMDLLCEIERQQSSSPEDAEVSLEPEIIDVIDHVMNEWSPLRSRRLPVFEEISTYRDQMAC